MKKYGSLKSELGEAAFLGMIRASDEMGANEFYIEIAGRNPMCGEWQIRFKPNGHDMDAEIVSFGYADPQNVGNPHEKARQRFDKREISVIMELTDQLFMTPHLHDNIFPRGAKFGGGVSYKEGWILMRE